MRATTQPCFSPDGMTTSNAFTTVFHGRGDCTQRHDDDAVTTIILANRGDAERFMAHSSHSNDVHAHDEGLVHGHEWATSTPMMR